MRTKEGVDDGAVVGDGLDVGLALGAATSPLPTPLAIAARMMMMMMMAVHIHGFRQIGVRADVSPGPIGDGGEGRVDVDITVCSRPKSWAKSPRVSREHCSPIGVVYRLGSA